MTDTRPVASEPLIGLAWMWRLRWGTVVVQCGAIALAILLLDLELPLAALLSVAAVTAASNALLGRSLCAEGASRTKLAGVILLDVGLHTIVLYWSGGAANPFSSFFVVHVAIAALLLGPSWAAVIVGATSLSFGSLFFIPIERLGPHALHMAAPMHLQGMWVAYVLSAAFVAFFVSQVAKALRARERELLTLQDYAANIERVASLGTVATGAAHELGSPLASIAISATELADQLSLPGYPAELGAEARHIREEVSRCRHILDRLASGAGQQPGEALAAITFAELERCVRKELGSKRAARVCFEAAGDVRFVCPLRGLVQALVNLIQNAIDATVLAGKTDFVTVTLARSMTELRFEVVDHGAGIAVDVLGRLGEPFFTTRPGEGMGLGLYVARSFAGQMSGALDFESTLGAGTSATLRMPCFRASSGDE